MNEREWRSPALPVGIFDSGIGGLSVLGELLKELPSEDFVYFGDNAHVPYGPRPLLEVRGFCQAIAEWFLSLPVKLVVVACNAASAASLKHLRQLFPQIPFVGMEPAVKPAAAHSRSGKVGVLATAATFQGELFESVVKRFAADVEVLEQPCPGLAEFIEEGAADDPGLTLLLKQWIDPMLEQGIDHLVLGCTHYPLIRDRIAAVAGSGVRLVDPSSAIAKRTRQVLSEQALLAVRDRGSVAFRVSGAAAAFSRTASRILGETIVAEQVQL